MKYVLTTIAVCILLSATAQQSADRVLYGKIVKDCLTQPPYDKWFSKGYTEYNTNTATKSKLLLQSTKGISIEIFFGTWCGDSKREVPRFIKILDDIKFNMANTKLVCVGGSDSLYKQSPQGEEKGKGIFRVPVFIVYKNGIEINRINESPALSLEKDLLSILNGEAYTPNYKSFASINKWLADGSLLDSNIAPRNFAAQLKPLVNNEHELNSLGYLLLKQNFKKEALTIFRINANLYPESGNVLSSLGEGYLKNGNAEKAAQVLESSILLTKDAAALKEILSLLYEAKGFKP
ncbi:tetratricopeptide repeat protein [Ferruginibacter sp. SUN106]|uniref:tetratricopeptide repeat protein n=1 Tax=Ferruginibacter sp. SUN106 TaxID=2978348 RepID=UPI003D35B086